MAIVALDAGHGKLTAGKRSFDESFFEYEFNRDIVKRISAHLKRHGITVVLTAPTDVDVPLTNRCNIAISAKADILVSIHANAFGTDWNTANGWEIYYSEGSTKGKKLADMIHSTTIPTLDLTDRGVKSTTEFTMVVKPTMPSVLIEHFFYTNKVELAKCNTSAYRDKFALVDAKGIVAYLGLKWIDEVKEVPTIPTTNKTYIVQVGSFTKKDNALVLQRELIGKGYKAIIKEI